MSSNPTMIDETRKIVKFYNRKIKNQPNMKLNELKNLIKNEIRAILAEGATETETAPTKKKTKEEEKTTTKPRRGLDINPDTHPGPTPKKAQTPQKEGMSKGISDIVKKYKLLKKK
jgi:hypothetical protein